MKITVTCIEEIAKCGLVSAYPQFLEDNNDWIQDHYRDLEMWLRYKEFVTAILSTDLEVLLDVFRSRKCIEEKDVIAKYRPEIDKYSVWGVSEFPSISEELAFYRKADAIGLDLTTLPVRSNNTHKCAYINHYLRDAVITCHLCSSLEWHDDATILQMMRKRIIRDCNHGRRISEDVLHMIQEKLQ